jgi:hypothetical protein
MTAETTEIPPGDRTEWAPWPAFTADPVARDGCDDGREAETGE